MPLFPNKFSPKKIPSRKPDPNSTRVDPSNAQEFSTEIGPIKLHLGDQETTFENGQWIPGQGLLEFSIMLPLLCRILNI